MIGSRGGPGGSGSLLDLLLLLTYQPNTTMAMRGTTVLNDNTILDRVSDIDEWQQIDQRRTQNMWLL
jgi:hypothetical protein